MTETFKDMPPEEQYDRDVGSNKMTGSNHPVN